jgi:hypothetical protein
METPPDDRADPIFIQIQLNAFDPPRGDGPGPPASDDDRPSGEGAPKKRRPHPERPRFSCETQDFSFTGRFPLHRHIFFAYRPSADEISIAAAPTGGGDYGFEKICDMSRCLF